MFYADALEILQSCTKPLKFSLTWFIMCKLIQFRFSAEDYYIHKCYVFRAAKTSSNKKQDLSKWTYAELRDTINTSCGEFHCNDVMTWKCFPYYWPLMKGIHWSPMDSPHKGSVMQSLDVFCVVHYTWRSCWTNVQVSDDLECHDITVMPLGRS